MWLLCLFSKTTVLFFIERGIVNGGGYNQNEPGNLEGGSSVAEIDRCLEKF